MEKKLSVLSLLSLAAISILAACGKGYFQEVGTVLSPSGKLVAVQYHIGAGPISADEWEVRIRDAGIIADPQEFVGCVAWKSARVGVQSISWESESKLRLGVPDLPEAHSYEHTFKNKGCAGVSVTWYYEPYVKRQRSQ